MEAGTSFTEAIRSRPATPSRALPWHPVIAHRWRHKKAVVIAAYGLATLVSASRFSGQKHFASDIVAGGVMGWFIGRHVFEAH